MSPDGFLSHHHSPHDPREGRSLDLVQRVVLSVLIAFVLGVCAAALALYLVLRGDQDLPGASVIGLWVMSGVIGLVTAGAILMINRRKPYHPLILLGLLPMIASWYGVFH